MAEAVWKRAPGGRWVIYGPADYLAERLASGRPVAVRNYRRGGISEIRIEHVTRSFADGNAYGWPVGLASPPLDPVELEPVTAPSPRAWTSDRHRRYGRGHRRGQRQRRL